MWMDIFRMPREKGTGNVRSYSDKSKPMKNVMPMP